MAQKSVGQNIQVSGSAQRLSTDNSPVDVSRRQVFWGMVVSTDFIPFDWLMPEVQ